MLGVVAGAVPFLWVRRKAKKRLALFEEQFPEAIDLIARALRAGHALPTALQLASEEVPDPVGAEFRLLFEKQNYGLSMTDALREFGERVPLLDARFFVTAVQTQREMGGNLSEVLDRLAAVIRERFKVKRQVRAVSAHGRITGCRARRAAAGRRRHPAHAVAGSHPAAGGRSARHVHGRRRRSCFR